MTNEELLNLDTSKMTDEQARAYGIDILENNLTPKKDLIKRRGSFALLFVSTYIVLAISETPKQLLYLSLFVAAIAVFLFVNVLTTQWTRNRTLKQFRTNTFTRGYKKFSEQYQEYLTNEQKKQAQREAQQAARKARKKPQKESKAKPTKGSKPNLNAIARQNTKNK